jgi:hypothetical protein
MAFGGVGLRADETVSVGVFEDGVVVGRIGVGRVSFLRGNSRVGRVGGIG